MSNDIGIHGPVRDPRAASVRLFRAMLDQPTPRPVKWTDMPPVLGFKDRASMVKEFQYITHEQADRAIAYINTVQALTR